MILLIKFTKIKINIITNLSKAKDRPFFACHSPTLS